MSGSYTCVLFGYRPEVKVPDTLSLLEEQPLAVSADGPSRDGRRVLSSPVVLLRVEIGPTEVGML